MYEEISISVEQASDAIFVADEKGGAYIRFLDRRTSIASRMYFDDGNQVWLSFSDFTTTPPSRTTSFARRRSRKWRLCASP